MKKWLVRVLTIILLAVSICAGLVACGPCSRNPSSDELGGLGLKPGTGRVTGIVVDKGDFLPEGATPQTYEGASIVIYRAVEAGTYKLSGEEPAHISYEVGEMVAEIESKEYGSWQVDLDPGKYFIRAFYGDSSYSESMLVEVDADHVLQLRLELIHGV